MNPEIEKKVKQSDIVLNYLNGKKGRKITAERAMKITKAKSMASMNYLLPIMRKEGLITRIGTGVYILPGSTLPVTKATKKVKKALPFKKSFKKSTTTLDTNGMRSQLIAKKQEYLINVEAIDKQIENIDKLEKHATSVIKNASTVL